MGSDIASLLNFFDPYKTKPRSPIVSTCYIHLKMENANIIFQPTFFDSYMYLLDSNIFSNEEKMSLAWWRKIVSSSSMIHWNINIGELINIGANFNSNGEKKTQEQAQILFDWIIEIQKLIERKGDDVLQLVKSLCLHMALLFSLKPSCNEDPHLVNQKLSMAFLSSALEIHNSPKSEIAHSSYTLFAFLEQSFYHRNFNTPTLDTLLTYFNYTKGLSTPIHFLLFHINNQIIRISKKLTNSEITFIEEKLLSYFKKCYKKSPTSPPLELDIWPLFQTLFELQLEGQNSLLAGYLRCYVNYSVLNLLEEVFFFFFFPFFLFFFFFFFFFFSFFFSFFSFFFFSFLFFSFFSFLFFFSFFFFLFGFIQI